MISIIHASRGRAQMAYDTSQKWLANAGCDVEYILSLDYDDPELELYQKLFSAKMIINANKSSVDAINKAARESEGEIFVVISDDFDCPAFWGKSILDAVMGKSDWLLKTPDGIQKWIITLPIMDRIYYDRFGYIYNPAYLHMFCDTEMSCVGDLLDKTIYADIAFKHNHHSTGAIPSDSTSVKADSTWNQGKATFINRYKINFELDPRDIKGEIKENSMVNWVVTNG